MKKMCLILIVGMMLTGNLHAQADPLHKELIRLALDNNRNIQKAELDITSSELQMKQVRSYRLPQLSAGIESKYYIERPTIILPGETFGSPVDIKTQLGKPINADGSIRASQLLLNKSLWYDLKTVEKSSDLYKLMKIKTEEDVIYQVSLAYYYYLSTLEGLKIIRENTSLLLKNKQIATRLIENDMALPTDTNRIDLKINELKKQENLLNVSLLEQQNGIRMLIDDGDFQFPEPEEEAGYNQEILPAEWNTSVNRTDIQILEKQLTIQDLQIEKAKAAYRPTTSLYASYGINVQQDHLKDMFLPENWNQILLLGFQTSIPIYSGGRNKAKIQQTRVNYMTAETNLAQAKLNETKKKNETYNKYLTLQQNRDIQLKNITLSSEIYKVSLLKYEEGLLPLTDLLTASTDMSNAKLNHTRSSLELYMGALDVLKSNGMLNTLNH